jgi:hypothetical protein
VDRDIRNPRQWLVRDSFVCFLVFKMATILLYTSLSLLTSTSCLPSLPI